MDITQPFLIIISAFFALGLIFVFIGFSKKRLIRGWEQTSGVIIQRENSLSGSHDFIPSFEFTAHNGITYRVKSKVLQVPGMTAGKQVTVHYNPENPNEAQLNTFAQNGSLFILIGAFAIGLAFFFTLIFSVLSWLFSS